MLQTFRYEAIDARLRGVFRNLEQQLLVLKSPEHPETITVQKKTVLRSKFRD